VSSTGSSWPPAGRRSSRGCPGAMARLLNGTQPGEMGCRPRPGDLAALPPGSGHGRGAGRPGRPRPRMARAAPRFARARRSPRWIAPQRAPKVATRAVPRAGAVSSASPAFAAGSVTPLTWSRSSSQAARAPSPGERHQAPRWRGTGSRKGLHHRPRGLQPEGEAQAAGGARANRLARLQARPRGSPRRGCAC